MWRLPPEFADPEQGLPFTWLRPEGLPSLAPLPSRPPPFPRSTEFHHGHAAVKLGDGSEHLANQAPRWIIGVRGKICPGVGGDDSASGVGELLEDDLAHHEVAGKPRRVLHEDDLHPVGLDTVEQSRQAVNAGRKVQRAAG